MKKEVRQLISKLKKKTIGVNDIPHEFRLDFEIIKTERALGLRRIEQCGYDVISNLFFVEESIVENNKKLATQTFV